MARLLTVLSILVLAAGTAHAITRIVDASGGGDFTTVQAAIDAANPADEIVVRKTGLYDEALNITKGIVVRGEVPTNRPIITLRGNTTQPATGGSGDAVYIQADNTTVTLQDLILIPSKTSPPTDDAISCTPATATGVLGIEIINVLISGNDGSDLPLADSFWDTPDTGAPGVVRFVDDPFFAMTRTGFGGVLGVINTHFTNFEMYYWASGTNADLIVYPSDDGIRPSSHIWNGVYLSGSVSDGTQISAATSSDFVVDNFWVRDSTASGMSNFQGNNWTLTNSVFLNCGAFGVDFDSDTVKSVYVEGCLFANTGAEGFWTAYAAAGPQSWTIKDCTFYNCGSATPAGTDGPFSAVKMEADVIGSSVITLTDCVILGPNTAAENLGAGSIVFDHCVLAQSGPYGLTSVARNTSTGTITQIATFSSDPGVLSIATAPLASNSFDVTASALQTASSTGGVLSGWGDFVILLGAEGSWGLYE